MEMKGIMGGLNRACEWIVRISLLNVLWVGFTLLGLVVFGIFPATVAMFTITRKWIQGDTELPIVKHFWTYYRQEFLKSNLLGLILILLGVILAIDLFFFRSLEGMMGTIIFYIMVAVAFNYLVMLFYIIPVYVHYDLKLLQYIKNALIIGMSNPLHTFAMVLAIVFIYYLLQVVPAAFLFLSAAPLSLIVMHSTNGIFTKIAERKQIQESNEIELKHNEI
ncbi:YesL family protein [Bacillus horti]|uniref:Membrane protein YesL n=1 Tax=Caldalkalibacillus horti TaxID=77523 RepID=A0ABT9VWR9_9BACI|nr:YesL family protein [Bacillus horti]MDQ0165433.1 putative membrane protein YesL [Bacillus horti]